MERVPRVPCVIGSRLCVALLCCAALRCHFPGCRAQHTGMHGARRCRSFDDTGGAGFAMFTRSYFGGWQKKCSGGSAARPHARTLAACTAHARTHAPFLTLGVCLASQPPLQEGPGARGMGAAIAATLAQGASAGTWQQLEGGDFGRGACHATTMLRARRRRRRRQRQRARSVQLRQLQQPVVGHYAGAGCAPYSSHCRWACRWATSLCLRLQCRALRCCKG